MRVSYSDSGPNQSAPSATEDEPGPSNSLAFDFNPAAELEYPSSFSPEMKYHCRCGCIPPQAFTDIALYLKFLTEEHKRERRKARIKPRSEVGCPAAEQLPDTSSFLNHSEVESFSGHGSAAISRYIRVHLQPRAPLDFLFVLGSIAMSWELFSFFTLKRDHSNGGTDGNPYNRRTVVEIMSTAASLSSLGPGGEDEWKKKESFFYETVLECILALLLENASNDPVFTDLDLSLLTERQTSYKKTEASKTEWLHALQQWCLRSLPAVLIAWFGLYRLLHLPLYSITPALWLLPSSFIASGVAAWLEALGTPSARGVYLVFGLSSNTPQLRLRGDVVQPLLPCDAMNYFSSEKISHGCSPGAYLLLQSFLFVGEGGQHKGLPPSQLGFIFTPMDAASVGAVRAVCPVEGERILDLCCSPGMKLQAIAEKMIHGRGFVIGVDRDLQRISLTRSLLPRNFTSILLPSGRHEGSSSLESEEINLPVGLFCGDGVVFSLANALSVLQLPGEQEVRKGTTKVSTRTGLTSKEGYNLKRQHLQQRKRTQMERESIGNFMMAGSKSFITLPVYVPTNIRELLKELSSGPNSMSRAACFDACLVDAECTHDGSLSHLHLQAVPCASSCEDSKESRGDEMEQNASLHEHPQCNDNAESAHSPRSNSYRMEHLNIHPNQVIGSLHVPAVSPERIEEASSFPCNPLIPEIAHRWPFLLKMMREDSLFTWLLSNPLLQLQLGLLMNGFENVRHGGRVVYSTCSMSYLQNEYIIRCFLSLVNVFRIFPQCYANLVSPFLRDEELMPSQESFVRSALEDHPLHTPGCDHSLCRSFSPLVPSLVQQLVRLRHALLHLHAEKEMGEQASLVQNIDESEDDFFERLNTSRNTYAVVSSGNQRLMRLLEADKKRAVWAKQCHKGSSPTDFTKPVGERLWPLALKTSFQYIAKIKKMSVEDD